MKSLEAALAELEGAIKAAPYMPAGAPPPRPDITEVRSEVIRDGAGRITKILTTNADGSVTRKIIERDADHRISHMIESMSKPFVQRASPRRATTTDDGGLDLVEELRKRSAALRAQDSAQPQVAPASTKAAATKPEEVAAQDMSLVLPGSKPARKRKSWKKLDRIQRSAHAEGFRKFVQKAGR